MRFPVPMHMLSVMRRIRDTGAHVYVVGGAVRDWLRGVEPKDIDLASSLRPKEVVGLFADERVVETGARHGTVTVFPRNAPVGTFPGVEVTTFRKEGPYSDYRRPDVVQFVGDIREDLGRRDFTINAMAYDPFGDALVDPYDGEMDVQNGIVRAVGDPHQRFREDALRMLRAVRFIAELDYQIDAPSKVALIDLGPMLRTVSKERIQAEFSRIVMAPAVGEGFHLMDDAKLLPYIWPEEDVLVENTVRGRWKSLAQACALAPRDLTVRLAVLLCEVGISSPIDRRDATLSQQAAAEAKHFLRHLKYANAIARNVVGAITHHTIPFEELPSVMSMARLVGEIGEASVRAAASVRETLFHANGFPLKARDVRRCIAERLDEVIRQGLPVQMKDLAINGRDLLTVAEIPPGPLVGELLRLIQTQILSGNLENRRADILTFVESYGWIHTLTTRKAGKITDDVECVTDGSQKKG